MVIPHQICYYFLPLLHCFIEQFLFDDYIRAHLSREHRWFKKHKNEPEINNMYPYDRALKFARDIRKLGVNDAGKSFLDQFRILITEIGECCAELVCIVLRRWGFVSFHKEIMRCCALNRILSTCFTYF